MFNLYALIYNIFLEISILPQKMNMGRGVLLPKKKIVDHPYNSRIVCCQDSIKSVIHVAIRINTQIYIMPKLHNCQAGAISGKDINDAIYQVERNIYYLYNNNLPCMASFKDVRKCFDSYLFKLVHMTIIYYFGNGKFSSLWYADITTRCFII